MLLNPSKLLFVFLFIFICSGLASAQDGPNSRPDLTKNMDLPEGMRENLAKSRLKQEEEDYKELIKRTEEAVKISEELTATYEQSKKFSDDDTKKIDRLEKVVKKIRQDLGAEDDKDEDSEDKPSSLMTTLTTIKDKTSNLLAELKKTTRYSVSVVAIESSNTLLRLVKFIKLKK